MDRIDLVFKALSDPARVRILEALHRPDAVCCTDADRVCACDLEAHLGLSQPTVSHHMKVLVQAGLVEAEKRGRWVHYRLRRERFRALVDRLAVFAAGREGGSRPAKAA